MNVLVTGATGFIGRAIVEALARPECGHRVVALVREGYAAAGPLRDGVERVAVDLAAPLEESRLPAQVDAVVHFATPRDRASARLAGFAEQVRVNVEATARLYEWARERGARSIVHASSLSVYQPVYDVGVVMTEEMPLVAGAADSYPLTKRWGEEIAASYRAAIGAVATLRLAHVIGPHMRPSGAFEMLAKALRAGDDIALAPPDGCLVSPVVVADVVDLVVRALDARLDGTFNVGGPDVLLEREAIAILAARLGRAPRFIASATERAESAAVSTARLDAALPGRLRTPFRAAVDAIW